MLVSVRERERERESSHVLVSLGCHVLVSVRIRTGVRIGGVSDKSAGGVRSQVLGAVAVGVRHSPVLAVFILGKSEKGPTVRLCGMNRHF